MNNYMGQNFNMMNSGYMHNYGGMQPNLHGNQLMSHMGSPIHLNFSNNLLRNGSPRMNTGMHNLPSSPGRIVSRKILDPNQGTQMHMGLSSPRGNLAMPHSQMNQMNQHLPMGGYNHTGGMNNIGSPRVVSR